MSKELVVVKTSKNRQAVRAFDLHHITKDSEGNSFDEEILHLDQFDRIPNFDHLLKDGLDLGLSSDQLRLAAFIALPRCLRPTQKVLAGYFGVDLKTLWNWQSKSGFDFMVAKLTRSFFAKDVADILKVQREKALLGDGAAARLILAATGIVGGFDSRKEDIHNTINNTMNVFVTESDAKEMVSDLTMYEGELKAGLRQAEATLEPVEGLDY